MYRVVSFNIWENRIAEDNNRVIETCHLLPLFSLSQTCSTQPGRLKVGSWKLVVERKGKGRV